MGRARRRLRAFRPFTVRPRLTSSGIFGIALYFLLPASLRAGTRGLIAWDAGVTLFLGLSLYLMAHADGTTMRRRAALQDEGRNFILLLSVCATVASLAVIATEFAGVKGEGKALELAHALFTGVTIILSWLFVQITFALHYAHGYYTPLPDPCPPGTKGGLAFPGDEEPDYWDFIHFAIVIGVAAQTADIAIRSKEMRRVATLHSVIAFAFNTAILALMVNIAAGLL